MGLSADYSSVAAGGVDFKGVKGESGAQSATAYFTAEVPVNDAWFVPVGIISRDFFLGTVAGAPIPAQIETLGFETGLGCRLNDQWTVAASAGPRIYRLDSVDNGDIGVGGMARAMYKWKPNLTVAFGFAVNPDRDAPVLPIVGVRWNIRTNLTLGLMYPRSGLDYRLIPRLNVFAGFDGNYVVFRADDRLGDKIGMSQYNNGLGTYRDFHVCVGGEYRIIRGFSAFVEGGYSFERELHYQRIGQTVKFDPAPYIQTGLKYLF